MSVTLTKINEAVAQVAHVADDIGAATQEVRASAASSQHVASSICELAGMAQYLEELVAKSTVY